MKKLLLTAIMIIGFTSGLALANVTCGIPPIPRIGCHVVCICDDGDCYWVNVCG